MQEQKIEFNIFVLKYVRLNICGIKLKKMFDGGLIWQMRAPTCP